MNEYFGFKSAAALCFLVSAVTATAEPAAPDVSVLVTKDLIKDLQDIVRHDVVQISVQAQNKRNADLGQPEIDALDKKWRAETKANDSQPLIARTLSNPSSYYLLRKQGEALGLYSEIFLMDNKGLNVGQSAVTSDYWQGDEGKWQKTFLKGGDAVFVDEAEWHDGSKTWRVQVNIAVADKESGKAIGAATFEINLTEMQRRLQS